MASSNQPKVPRTGALGQRTLPPLHVMIEECRKCTCSRPFNRICTAVRGSGGGLVRPQLRRSHVYTSTMDRALPIGHAQAFAYAATSTV